MEEQTVFTPQSQPSQPGQVTSPVVPPISEPQIEQPAPSPGNLSRKPGIPFGKILRVFIGLLVILLILTIFIGVILPKFGSKKVSNVTLTYWGLWENKAVMQSIISEFERENPTISVEYSKEDIKEYRERLETRIANGSGPDIFRFHNTWYPMLSSDLLPIPTNIISREQFKEKYFSVAARDLIKNGAIYGLPFNIDALALFINNDKLSAAGVSIPSTWNDFITASQTLTIKDQDGKIQTAGASIGTFENVSHAPDIISLLFVQNGVDTLDISQNSQRVSDALDFYTSFAKGDGAVWNGTLDNSILSFSQGNTAMIFAYSWDYFTIKALNPDLEFQIAPVPQLTSDNPTNLASYWADGISVKSKHQREALLFLKFLAEESSKEKLYTEEAKTRFFGEIYPETRLASKLEDDPTLSIFVKQAGSATSSYFVDSTHDNGLNDKLNNYLKDSVNATLGGSSPQSATETLIKGFSQVIFLYEQEQ
ncbi:MAG: hypothetical protein A2152_00310 [Candidatus Levybacteria bacterium RBG_16_35_6]|nr:MAG: Extracellular solute-binding protein family 1 [Candidatus Levybacteria bacterium GW2011_GWA2_36_13]KKQ01129.1 MAG: Extracellular solute-binding protein family 1 [Candidatus Levybacteria bacterium GW2011_GWB1_36_18]KKQ58411.1 MAG: Extracellular solute-binding protein family 1 [Microgenomates group bacterium GW2011_GWC1_38_14]KKR16458.1 MAG: Extracellular solute-binding protein family 1 [Candidatus Levybacteria bacterium GW2011_GWA1_39_34]OGH08948.1 MAG: hypothetical protein A2152_00310 [